MKRLLIILLAFINIQLCYQDGIRFLSSFTATAQTMTRESSGSSSSIEWYSQVYKCKKCGMTFDDQKKRDEHQSDNCFECENNCGIKFATEVEKETHERFYCQSGVDEERTTCSYCRAECSTVENRKTHESTCSNKSTTNTIENESSEYERRYLLFSVIPNFTYQSVSQQSYVLGGKFCALCAIAQGSIIRSVGRETKCYSLVDVPAIEKKISKNTLFSSWIENNGIESLYLHYSGTYSYGSQEASYDSEEIAGIIDSQNAVVVTDKLGEYYCTIIGYYGTYYKASNSRKRLEVQYFYALDKNGNLFELPQLMWTNLRLYEADPEKLASTAIEISEM